MLQQCREAAGENHEKRQPERLEEILGPVAFQAWSIRLPPMPWDAEQTGNRSEDQHRNA